MRTILFFLFLTFFSFYFAQDTSEPLVISKLSENIFVYTTFKNLGETRFPSNGMYVVTNNGVVLIDTPWDTTQFQPLLDSIESRHHKKVIICISTHFHDDRTAGLSYYQSKGIKTYSYSLTKEYCKKKKEHQAEFTFKNDTTFSLGEFSFEAYYPGEGHSPDNIVVWVKEAKVLYGGCLIKSSENKHLGNVADANISEWKKSILKVMNRFPKPEFIIPGHFGWESKEALEHTLELIKQHK